MGKVQQIVEITDIDSPCRHPVQEGNAMPLFPVAEWGDCCSAFELAGEVVRELNLHL